MSISRLDLLQTPVRAFRPLPESESDFRAILDCAQGTACAKSKAIPPGPPQPLGFRPLPIVHPESQIEPGFGGNAVLAQGTATAKAKAIPPGPPQPLGFRHLPTGHPESRLEPEFGGTALHAQGTGSAKAKAIPPGPPQSLGGQNQPPGLSYRDLFEALEGGDLIKAQRAFDCIHDNTLRRLAGSPGSQHPKAGPLLSFFEELAVLGQELQAGDRTGAQAALTALLEKYPRAFPHIPAIDSLSQA